MSSSAPLPKDAPLIVIWEKFKTTPEFENARKWALHSEHLNGSLWSVFAAGWLARESYSAAIPINKRRRAKRLFKFFLLIFLLMLLSSIGMGFLGVPDDLSFFRRLVGGMCVSAPAVAIYYFLEKA